MEFIDRTINCTQKRSVPTLLSTGAGRTIIEGVNIHIFVFTDCKNNRFQKKLTTQERTYMNIRPPPPIIVLAAPLLLTSIVGSVSVQDSNGNIEA